MGYTLKEAIPHFKVKENLIACMAHIVNLVSKAGIETFDLNDGNYFKLPLPPSLCLCISDTAIVNLTSIQSWLHIFLKKTHKSDKLRASLQKMINDDAGLKCKVGLVQEVLTT